MLFANCYGFCSPHAATAVYSLEGINLVLPIESSLKDQRYAGKVIGWGTAAYTFLCALFGAFGYFVGTLPCQCTPNVVVVFISFVDAQALVLVRVVGLLLTVLPETRLWSSVSHSL